MQEFTQRVVTFTALKLVAETITPEPVTRKQIARIIRMQRRQTKGTAGRPGVLTRATGAKDVRDEATLTQALYMVRLYAEILAMDETIIKRIRQLIASQSDRGDREGSLYSLRLILAQLEKVGQRIAYWNARLRSLLNGQLSGSAPRPASRA